VKTRDRHGIFQMQTNGNNHFVETAGLNDPVNQMKAYDELPQQFRDIIKDFPIWLNSVSMYNIINRIGEARTLKSLQRIYYLRRGKTNVTEI
jgi:hypothetical protein